MISGLDHVAQEIVIANQIDTELFDKFDVKRGLRNRDGSGVLAGLSRVSSAIGIKKIDDQTVPVDGQLTYRGVEIRDIIKRYENGQRYCFEDVTFFLLVGRYPTSGEMQALKQLINEHRAVPSELVDHVIRGIPSRHVMNKFQTAVSALYAFDADPESLDPYNNFIKSISVLAKLPTILAYSYLSAFKPGAEFVVPPADLSIAETFLYVLHEGRIPTRTESTILDLSLVLHAEHGGGNNSTFATRVVTSSESDIYSSLAAGIGGLKGPLHGSANKMVMEMMADLQSNIKNHSDIDEMRTYLTRLINKEVFDRSGLIYGFGHAVYTISDPRALVLIDYAKQLAAEKARNSELQFYFDIAREAPSVFQLAKGHKKVIAPNIDFYSGFVYDCLGIPEPIYTPIFGLARATGWCAHRIEEILTGKRIIRPAYKYI